MTTVFVSHSVNDVQWATEFAGILERSGLRTFLRERDVLPGQVMIHELETAMTGADAAVIVLSSSAAEDAAVRAECAVLLEQAHRRGIRIVPVLHGCADVWIPPLVSTYRWADFRGLSNEEQAALTERLADTLVRQHEDVGPAFVVAYAELDTAYGVRLAAHLAEAALPAWSVADLRFGSSFVHETREQIRQARAMVVVMSPDAERSADVQRQVLEGLRYGRAFFPVLLRGQPNFLLASSWHFDARGDRLPGASHLNRLRHGIAAPVTRVDPARVVIPGPAEAPLSRLRALLAEGDLAHADLWTTTLLLGAANRLDAGWLEPAVARRLPLPLLTAIDAAWSETTGGAHGFRSQLGLFRLETGGGTELLDAFVAYGWRTADKWRAAPRYEQLLARESVPAGFFPTLRNPQVESHRSCTTVGRAPSSQFTSGYSSGARRSAPMAVRAIPGLIRVPNQKIGIVSSRFGNDERDEFDIKMYDSRGIQASVLPPNSTHMLNPVRFQVDYAPQTYVPDGTIGLINALAGRVKPPGRSLGQYIKDADYFQDGAAFLRGGGEQGRQLGFLPGGARYNINPRLFEVITVERPDLMKIHGLTEKDLQVVRVPAGSTGVVITQVGKRAGQGIDDVGRLVEGHHQFQLPWVFVGRDGQSGVQAEPLDVGTYEINPWFAQVVQIPTRELALEWTSRSTDKPDNFDTQLEQIEVNINGYRIGIDVTQTLTIPPATAPRLVRRFGQGDVDDPSQARREPVQRFVGRVLGGTVSGYFNQLAGGYQIMEFIINFGVFRTQLQDKVVNELDGWDVIAGATILEGFTTEDRELDMLRRTLAGQDIELRKELQRLKLLEAELDSRKVQAQIDIIGIEMAGAREVEVLRQQVKILGPYQVVLERVVERMGNINVPQFIGGDTADRLLAAMPMSVTQDMIRDLLSRYAADGDSSKPVIAEARVNEPDNAES